MSNGECETYVEVEMHTFMYDEVAMWNMQTLPFPCIYRTHTRITHYICIYVPYTKLDVCLVRAWRWSLESISLTDTHNHRMQQFKPLCKQGEGDLP